MAIDRIALKQNSQIDFFKSLGTGSGRTFTPSDADSTTWALLITSKSTQIDISQLSTVMAWRKFALSEEIFELEAISAHGMWSGLQPFALTKGFDWRGEVATITRARIRWSENLHFWRAVPKVNSSLKQTAGLIRAIGIGEAPLGLQGTFSHWQSQDAVRAFAYRDDAHRRAIEITAERRWYSEELFARFAVINHSLKTFI